MRLFGPRLPVVLLVACFLHIAAVSQSSLDSSQQIFIRVNQLGYQSAAQKIAIAFAHSPLPQAFQLVNAQTGRVVFDSSTTSIAGRWGEFEHHVEADFSWFRQSGLYFLRVGDAESPKFEISPDIYARLPDELLEFMREQRCGYNPFVDAVCHSFDGRTAYGPLPAGSFLDARGGWHDAGDQLKYLLTSSNATAQMLLAYQLKPSDFQDHFNSLGQPGADGIADVLDEARWGLDWMLKLHPAPDQLYHQVADDRDHKGFRLPQNETVDYGWGPGSYRVLYFADGRPQGLREFKSESTGVANLAGRYAAAMALGCQIWKNDPRHRDYARTLLRAGREVYALGKAKEGVQQGNSYGAPYRYEETTWADDMEWGAAELFRATGEKQFLSDAIRYARRAADESWMGKEQTKHYQYYPFINVGHYRLYDLVDGQTRKQLAAYYRSGLDQAVRVAQTNPYGIGVPFIWCSNNLVVALAIQAILYQRMTGDRRYHDLAEKQIDWLWGRNPWGFSMFTGIPAEGTFPRDVHLMTNAILKRPVRGALVDGPVYRRIFAALRGVSITEPDPLAAFQDERAVYHDDIKDYSTNEPTMDGTASAVLLWSLQNEHPGHCSRERRENRCSNLNRLPAIGC
jgi:endoglucanase